MFLYKNKNILTISKQTLYAEIRNSLPCDVATEKCAEFSRSCKDFALEISPSYLQISKRLAIIQVLEIAREFSDLRVFFLDQ